MQGRDMEGQRGCLLGTRTLTHFQERGKEVTIMSMAVGQ